MTKGLLKAKLLIDEKNGELFEKVRAFSSFVAALRKSPHGLELNFKARCLERLYTLIRSASDNCANGFPVTATLVAGGVIETAGLLILFETRMKKTAEATAKEKLETVRRFVFSTKKFGNEKRSVHAMDCVRALIVFHRDVELLYDILCEAVHPNWLGVSQFKEFRVATVEVQEQDELVTMAVFQALLLGHKVANTFTIALGNCQPD